MKAWSRLRDKDALSGAIFAVTGAVFAVQSLDLSMGSLRSMGPGYVPMALSLLLVGFGLAILVRGLLRGGEKLPAIPLRGLVAITAALLIFAFGVRGAGLGPTVVAMVLVACLGSRKTRSLPSIGLAIALALFCWIAFVWGLGVPLGVIGPWLGGY